MKNKPDSNQSKTSQFGTEQISSFVDGEFDSRLDDETCIDYLVKDKDASQRWERYHLIGDTLKRNLPPVIDSQLASRVMAELENEPTVLAPSRTSFFGKQMAGFAIAASVATIAVLGVQFMYKEDAIAPVPQVAQTSPSKIPVNKELFRRDIQTVTQTMDPVVTRSQQLAQPLTQQHSTQIFNQYHPNINKYLLNHNQRAARGVVQGVIPYARIITSSDREQIARQNYLQNKSKDQLQK